MKKIYLIIVIIFASIVCFGQNRSYLDFIIPFSSDWSYKINENYDNDFYEIKTSYDCGQLYFSEQTIKENKMIFNICAYSIFRIDIKEDKSNYRNTKYIAPHCGNINYGSDFFEMDEIIALQKYVISNKTKLENEFGFLIKGVYFESSEMFETALGKSMKTYNKTHPFFTNKNDNIQKDEVVQQKYRVIIIVDYPNWDEEAERIHVQNLQNIEKEKQRKQDEKTLRMQSLNL